MAVSPDDERQFIHLARHNGFFQKKEKSFHFDGGRLGLSLEFGRKILIFGENPFEFRDFLEFGSLGVKRQKNASGSVTIQTSMFDHRHHCLPVVKEMNIRMMILENQQQ